MHFFESRPPFDQVSRIAGNLGNRGDASCCRDSILVPVDRSCLEKLRVPELRLINDASGRLVVGGACLCDSASAPRHRHRSYRPGIIITRTFHLLPPLPRSSTPRAAIVTLDKNRPSLSTLNSRYDSRNEATTVVAHSFCTYRYCVAFRDTNSFTFYYMRL